ncbi:MAG: LamG-like jellyroll fold domain-containing protein [Candidatus Micrarchaeia archaeon]
MAKSTGKAQIALEFLIVYSFVLVIFVILFALVASQRATTLSQQEYSELQLQVQNIVYYIDQAMNSGSGYYASVPVLGAIGGIPYNISISSSGVVIGYMHIGTQNITTYGFSGGRDLVVNGTLAQQGNGVAVYQVPIYKGFITVANSHGSIYIDEKPQSTLSLTENINVQALANQKVGSFDGTNYAYGSLTSYFGGNHQVTAVAWAYITPNANGPIFGVTNTPPGSGWNKPFISEKGLVVFGLIWGANSNNPISYPIQHPGWHMLAITYNPSGAGTETFYVDGVEVRSGSGRYSSFGSTDYWTTYISGAKPGGMNNYYNSMIADVQAYSSALTPQQIMELYKEGIAGAPVSNTIISWWPLNGNLNDYSGNGNNGIGSGMLYGSVMQFEAKAINGAGSNSSYVPVGFVTGKGTVGTTSSFIANNTNSTGALSEYITANQVVVGATNLTITAFNGNSTMAANLVGWWPLDTGYGSTFYDLSGYGATGSGSNVNWVPKPLDVIAVTSAQFNNGASAITGNLLFGTSNLTISAWINNTGTGSYWQNIAELYGNQNTKETLDIGVTAASGNAVIRWSNQANSFQNQPAGGIIKPNTWYLVTGVWNGNKNTLSIYINGTLVATGAGNGTIATFVNGFNIGGAYLGMSTFNGLISNVQVYNTALTPQQILQEYKLGITATPISQAGLIGWWPLAGNANDYSSSGNDGLAQGVAYKNTYFTGHSNQEATYFNPAQTSWIASTKSPLPNGTNVATIVAWIYPKPLQGDSTYAGIVRIDGEACTGKGLLLSLQGSSGHLSMATWCNDFVPNSGPKIVYNAWNFVAVVLNKQSVSLNANGQWINGTLPNLPSLQANAGACPYNFAIGSTDCPGRLFNGSIEDVQIYNAALTPAEIEALYQQGLPPFDKLNISLG